jgi:hypothetical protein
VSRGTSSSIPPARRYCYNQVFFDDRSGIHVLSIRSEVSDTILCGTRNHYVDLRYYHCADPDHPRWDRTTVLHDEHACIQPLGNLVDSHGAVHLLYQSARDDGHGKSTGFHLVYASSRRGAFAQHELPSAADGRLFLTKGGGVYLVTYSTGADLKYARLLDPAAGRFWAWQTLHLPITFNRLFPIDARSGSSASDHLRCAVLGAPGFPQENSIYLLDIKP